ncbi:MAG: hypothetical protein M3483_04575 [Gemmatimonadota bacterium]|nr:hypothetical protein [Gemmatimonadota bacterium]
MDVLDRSFRRLVERLRRERGVAGSGPLTVGEVYQQLIPYRSVRGDLGLSELPEYEHTLLRLLSGERGYVRLVPPAAQEELRRELGAANPILGIYRDYAGAEVHLDLARLPLPAEAPGAPPSVDTTASYVDDLQEALFDPAPQAPPTEPPAVPCRSCAAALPRGREVRYCPHCAAVQRAFPCRECGESVEPEWRFCIGCSAPQPVGVSG